MPNVFITLINFNGEKDTINCLDSLEKINTQGFSLSVIVIDNASKEVFKPPANYKNFKLHLIRSETNVGFSGGHNLGIKMALEKQADFVVIMNNDVILDINSIHELLNTFNDHKDCAIVSPKIYFAKGHEYHKNRYKSNEQGKVIWYAGGKMDWDNVLGSHIGVDEVDSAQFDKLTQTGFASGCLMMVKSEVFDKVGFFDDKYFLYYEDNDFSQRAKIGGFKIYFQPKSIIWHINAGSTGGSGSSMQDYYITRNRLYFASKYATLRTKYAIWRESIRLFFNGRQWQKKAVRDYYLHKFGKGSFT